MKRGLEDGLLQEGGIHLTPGNSRASGADDKCIPWGRYLICARLALVLSFDCQLGHLAVHARLGGIQQHVEGDSSPPPCAKSKIVAMNSTSQWLLTRNLQSWSGCAGLKRLEASLRSNTMLCIPCCSVASLSVPLHTVHHNIY
jgi:hypothetical protein